MNRDNLFRSDDGGSTWFPVPGQPKQYRSIHAVPASDGNLFITYGSSPGPSPMTNSGVWKFNTAPRNDQKSHLISRILKKEVSDMVKQPRTATTLLCISSEP